LTGTEAFVDTGGALPLTVLDYWQWASSDLLSNVARGVVAEFLVAAAVGATDTPRDPWADYDVLEPSGVTIEVKSAAYIQSWSQRALSKVSFGTRATRPPTLTPEVEDLPARRSQVWVFALLHHDLQETINPMDVSQWAFYVVPTWWLDARVRSQYSITLPSLHASEFGTPVSFAALHRAIREVAAIAVPRTASENAQGSRAEREF
jgi:hypothetical protein